MGLSRVFHLVLSPGHTVEGAGAWLLKSTCYWFCDPGASSTLRDSSTIQLGQLCSPLESDHCKCTVELFQDQDLAQSVFRHRLNLRISVILYIEEGLLIWSPPSHTFF